MSTQRKQTSCLAAFVTRQWKMLCNPMTVVLSAAPTYYPGDSQWEAFPYFTCPLWRFQRLQLNGCVWRGQVTRLMLADFRSWQNFSIIQLSIELSIIDCTTAKFDRRNKRAMAFRMLNNLRDKGGLLPQFEQSTGRDGPRIGIERHRRTHHPRHSGLERHSRLCNCGQRRAKGYPRATPGAPFARRGTRPAAGFSPQWKSQRSIIR